MPQRITGHTELIGLIATPIRHSKSPMMHNTAFEALGLDYAYLAFDFPPERLKDAVKGLKALGAKGWTVSMPYKADIIPLLDEISEVSRLSNSVNTVINRDGRLYGTVTDGTGYMRSLADRGFDVKGKKMTVLGCGGAATAICIQAALDGVQEISIFNANDAFFHRAEENAEKINANTGCVAHAYPLEDKARLRAEIADSALLANHGNWQGARDYAPREEFGPGALAQFEQLPVRLPADYDAYLRRKYGDYWKDPPASRQVSHHSCLFLDTGPKEGEG